MQGIWKKLNFKDDTAVMILNPPESFEDSIAELEGVDIIRDQVAKTEINFFLFFVKEKSEIDKITSNILIDTAGDVIVWFCYPKGSSKKYTCDFNRDNGWDYLKENGFGGVRQVAIDQDWSALRFRRSQYIKSK